MKLNLPSVSLVKRDDMKKSKAIGIKIASFIGTFLFAMFLCFLVIKENYFEIIGTLFEGAFIRPWKLALDVVLFLGFGIAIVPCFKMKYWNMGANGQVLIAALVSIVLMFYMEDWAAKSTFNNILLILLMITASIVAGVIWGVIPAVFKTKFGTNETLFTLMMNYISMGLVSYANCLMAEGKKESPGIINSATQAGYFPVVINKYFLPILIIVLMSVVVYFYMSKTKHGYEISVVGDSINTAKYAGMKTNKIIIRTLVFSGALCGIIGFLYASAINQSITKDTCGSLGFTGVLIAWLSNFNPFVMALYSFILAFLTNGTSKVSSVYRLGSNNLSSVIIGLIFFSILIAESFIRYKIKVTKRKKEVA